MDATGLVGSPLCCPRHRPLQGLLASDTRWSGSLGPRDAPESTAEAPTLPLTCMGLGPAPFCTPPPARGLDLPPLTGQPLGSAALLDPGSLLACAWRGRVGLQGAWLPSSLSEEGPPPQGRARLALCVLGADSSGRDEQDSMIFPKCM